jgi:hypothetical protein
LARSRQYDLELSEKPRLCLDLDGAAVLFHNDVMAHGQAKPAAFAGGKGSFRKAVITVSADGVSVDEMVDSVQSDESGNDKVDGNDIIQQARQNQDQDACDESNDRRKMFGSEGHDDLLGG